MTTRPLVIAIAFISVAQIAGLVSADDLRATADLEAKRTLPRLARHYAQFIDELDADVPADSADVLAAAEKLLATHELQVQQLNSTLPGIEVEASFLICGKRVVARSEMCYLMLQLGDVSRRLRAAMSWCDFAVRDERLKRSLARTEAARRNLVELHRVYAEFHSAAATRRAALAELRRLASGRYIVVEQDRYTGTKTPASPYESWSYVGRLHATANSPVFIAPPVKTEVKELFTVERLVTLKEARPHLVRLRRLVDAELEALGPSHFTQVQMVLAEEDESKQMVAISSLGWWNGKEGRDLIDLHLHGKSDSLRQAALATLGRLTHDKISLQRFATDALPEVRIEAAELAATHLHDYRAALGAVRILLSDSSEDVRRAGYAAMDRLSSVFNATIPQQLRHIASILHNQPAPVILDAIKWIEACGNPADPGLLFLKARYLLPLVKHRNESVEVAAKNAITNL